MALAGKRFVLTGMFPAASKIVNQDDLSDATGRLDIGKAEVKQQIRAYGGVVTSAISAKTTHLVAGEEPGNAKLEQAAKTAGTKLIDLAGLNALIAGAEPTAPKIELFSAGFEGNSIGAPRGAAAVKLLVQRGMKREREVQ